MIQQTQYGSVIRYDLARTIFGKGRYWTTCYWVNGTLIDTGCAHAVPEFLSALAGKPVHRIINTHTHEDHIGANGQLQSVSPTLEILAHPSALQVLSDPRHAQPLHPYRRVMWGWPTPCKAIPVQDGDLIEADGYHFQVHFTPGHSPDHLCLFEPDQGWLFSGDLFVGGWDRAIRAGCDIWQIISSLRKIAGLPVKMLFPSCARVRVDPHQALLSKIDYYESRGLEIIQLHRAGSPIGSIAKTLFGGPMLVEIVTLGHFSRYHLVRSYLNPLIN